MGSFEGNNWKIYLNKETRERVHEIKQHLEKNYEGPSDFVQQKLVDEKTLSVEQQIEKKQTELKNLQSDLEQLKQIKREREQMDKLRDKKELLKEKQKKLRKLGNQNTLSREQIRAEIVEKMREKAESSPKIGDIDDYLQKDRIKTRINRKVESRVQSTGSVDDLVEDVERLQKQVAELNGGREDWFMDLTQQEEEVEA